MALADMIHSEGLSGDFAEKPEALAALQAFKNASKTYATPGRKQVDGPLLNALSGQYDAYALNQISQHEEDYGPAVVSDGATVYHISLISILAVVCTWAENLWTARHKPAINFRSLRGIARQAITTTTNNNNFAAALLTLST